MLEKSIIENSLQIDIDSYIYLQSLVNVNEVYKTVSYVAGCFAIKIKNKVWNI